MRIFTSPQLLPLEGGCRGTPNVPLFTSGVKLTAAVGQYANATIILCKPGWWMKEFVLSWFHVGAAGVDRDSLPLEGAVRNSKTCTLVLALCAFSSGMIMLGDSQCCQKIHKVYPALSALFLGGGDM